MAGINGYSGFLSDIVQGNTKDFRISVKLANTPVDITGGKFYLTLATDKNSSTEPTLEIEIIELSDPTNGIAVGTISDTQTTALNTGSYYYSLRYITVAGKAYVMDMGKIKVRPGISARVS